MLFSAGKGLCREQAHTFFAASIHHPTVFANAKQRMKLELGGRHQPDPERV